MIEHVGAVGFVHAIIANQTVLPTVQKSVAMLKNFVLRPHVRPKPHLVHLTAEVSSVRSVPGPSRVVVGNTETYGLTWIHHHRVTGVFRSKKGPVQVNAGVAVLVSDSNVMPRAGGQGWRNQGLCS